MISGRRLLFVATALGLAFGLVGCGHVEVDLPCGNGTSDGAALADPSFEDSPSSWTLGANATIDDTVAHDGTRGLRVELDQGLGTGDVTRSAAFTGTDPDTDYEICFTYRFQHAKKARYTVLIGGYEQNILVDGDKSQWTHSSIVVNFSSDPTWIDISAGRVGAASEFEGSEFDDNVLWIDDIEIAPN